MPTCENQLFVSDVDGTLAHFRDIPQRNIDAITEFTSKGGIFTLCTGRNFGGTREFLSRVAINAPLITINGGCVYDYRADRPVYSMPLPDTGGELIRQVTARYPGVGVTAVDIYHYHIIRDGRTLYPEVEERLKLLVDIRGFSSWNPEDVGGTLSKYVMEMPVELAGELLEFCRSMAGDELTVTQAAAGSVEVMAAGATKGHGLLRLAEHLGIDPACTGAVGDHFNDLDLLRRAGWSAAVHGAPEPVRAAADYVTCPFEEGAVADALERFIARG